jgi:hypothetical protein
MGQEQGLGPVVVRYNQFPESLEEKLKDRVIPKDETVIIKTKQKRTATVVVLTDGAATKYPNSPVMGSEYIRHKWTVYYEGQVIQCGFIGSLNPQGMPNFIKPQFINGDMILQGGNSEHQMIYKLLALHPDFEEAIIKGPDAPLFYEQNPEAESLAELNQYRKRDKAVQAVNEFSLEEINILAQELGIQGKTSEKKLALRRLAESTPDRLLAGREVLQDMRKKDMINNAFALGIIELDMAQEAVVWAKDKAKISDFNINHSNQREAFIEMLIKTKDSRAETIYRTIEKLVNKDTEPAPVKESKIKLPPVNLKEKEDELEAIGK